LNGASRPSVLIRKFIDAQTRIKRPQQALFFVVRPWFAGVSKILLSIRAGADQWLERDDRRIEGPNHLRIVERTFARNYFPCVRIHSFREAFQDVDDFGKMHGSFLLMNSMKEGGYSRQCSGERNGSQRAPRRADVGIDVLIANTDSDVGQRGRQTATGGPRFSCPTYFTRTANSVLQAYRGEKSKPLKSGLFLLALLAGNKRRMTAGAIIAKCWTKSVACPAIFGRRMELIHG